MADYTSGAGPVGNTSGSAQQVGGATTNRLAKGAWQLTPELIAEIQPYLSFDLAKVVKTTPYLRPDTTYGINSIFDTGRGNATKTQDVTKEYSAILSQIRSRDNTSIYGTAGSVSGDSAARAFHDVYGGSDQASGGDAPFRPSQAATFDASGVAYDAAGKPIARPQDQWGNRPGIIASKPNYADARARQFQVDNPGYFQVGENPNNPGSWDRGALDTNNLPASYFPNGVADPNSMVKFDEKYGYIAPIALQKQSRPDFLSKYGQYIPIALFGAGVAGSMMAGGSWTQAAAPVSEGVPSSVAAGSTAAAGGAPAAGDVAAGSTGIFSQAAAPVSTGVPSSTGLGTGGGGFLSDLGGIVQDYGGTLAGGSGGGLLGALGGGGSGGGSGGLLSSLLKAGVSYYQATQIAKAMEVQDKSTDFSKTSGGHTSFDPSIRGLQDASLANTGALESGVMGYGSTFRARSDENRDQYNQMYAELTSNQNPFIQARVNPLKEQIAGSRGQIQRNQGLRGVSGSSFGNDELTNFDFGAQRQLGDASAMATHDALGSRSNTLGSLANLNQNRLTGETQLTNTMNTLNSNRTGIAKDRAALEQAGLGLSATSEAATRAADVETQNRYAQILQRLLGGSQ